MKTVSFVNMKGGVAKTTLSVNLANALNERADKSVLLIDIDPQFNATQCLFSGEEYMKRRLDGAHTIVNVFDDLGHAKISPIKGVENSPTVKLEDIQPWNYKSGFDVIPGDLELYRLDGATGQGRELRLRRYLEKSKASERYDYVIIDTPPTPSTWMMSALIASQHYVIPVKAEPLSRVGIDLLRGVVNRCSENFGHEIDCLGVIITLVNRQTKNYEETIEWLDKNKVWQDRRFRSYLPQRAQIARAQGEQKLILDDAASDVRSSLTLIMNEFLRRLDDVD